MSIRFNAEERLKQRIRLENNKNPRIWDTPPGLAARGVSNEIIHLTAVKWNKKQAEDLFTRAVEKNQKRFSDKEMNLFRWMCFHIYLGGTPTTNPYKEDLFGYFHGAMGAQCEFMYDHMKGPGITGLFASCGYTKYLPELDTWTDEHMSYVTDMGPLSSESYEWFANRRHAISKRLALVAARLMHAYQQHHIDLRAALALTDREWMQHGTMYMDVRSRVFISREMVRSFQIVS